MPRTFTYTTTSFREPRVISENQYNEIRRLLLNNPNAELDPNSESFIEHFKGQLIGIFVCFLIVVILGGIFGDEDGVHWVFITIALLLGIFSIFHLFIEAPSYATYIKKKKEYLSKIKYAILNTSSYREFYNLFYNG